MPEKTDRRCFLARGILGAAGVGAAAGSIEEKILKAAVQDGSAKPSPNAPGKPKTDISPGSMPCGKIGKYSVSRLLIGGNLIGGYAHSRDLMYVSRLFTEYNTESKVFETLDLAQACGINTIQMSPKCWDVVNRYNKARTTKIQTIVCISFTSDKAAMRDIIKGQIDLGADMLYSHGGNADNHMKEGGKIDVIGQMVDFIRAEGLPAGVGSHSLTVPMMCEQEGIHPDFFMKTFHSDRYWSATPKDRRKEFDFMRGNASDHGANNDNMWCNNPEETAAFMEKIDKPWLAFKVMAAGAISPRVAFPYAYRNGADFVVAGMFDFQVESDVKIAIEAIQKIGDNRKRPWCA